MIKLTNDDGTVMSYNDIIISLIGKKVKLYVEGSDCIYGTLDENNGYLLKISAVRSNNVSLVNEECCIPIHRVVAIGSAE